MEFVLTNKQMRDADSFTINVQGVSEVTLIERAGEALAEEVYKRFQGGRIGIFVGGGNNGADGKVLFKILSNDARFDTEIISLPNCNDYLTKKFDIIVDCLFGTGLNREVKGEYYTCIEYINGSDAFVISCDLPSGLSGDNGKVMGVAVKANLTITFQQYKLGHFLNDGLDYTGNLVVKDVGISVLGDEFVKIADNLDVKMLFNDRARNVHKGCFGKASIIGGSKNYTGSVILSLNALSALKMGIGYANLTVPESVFDAYVGKVPECTLFSFNDDQNKPFIAEDFERFLGYDAIAIGMGMGVTLRTYEIINYFLHNYTGKLLIDADGINALSKFGKDALKTKKCRVVLTPHIQEFSRLTGIDKSIILDNPVEHAVDFAKQFDCVVLLKNAVSVITDGKEIFLNVTGCAGMAKGGSGDVLSGLTVGLLARCESVINSVVSSAYIFGKAGEYAESKQNAFTITASDIIKELANVINDL